MHHTGAGELLEQQSREMLRASGSDGGVVQLARLCLRVRDQLLQVVDRQFGADRHDIGQRRQKGNRLEVLLWVVWQVLRERAVDRERARRRDREAIAVWIGLGDHVGARVAARARLVLEDESLAHVARNAFEYDAADHVTGAAGRERNDDLHGSIGISLSPDLARHCGGHRRDAHPAQKISTMHNHGVLPSGRIFCCQTSIGAST